MKKVLTTGATLLLCITSIAQTLQPGLLGEYYYFGPALREMPELEPNQKPSVKRIDPVVDFGKIQQMKLRFTNDLYVRWTGKIRVPKSDKYRFFLNSDDGSQLFIYGRKVVDNGGLHAMTEVSGEVDLPAGDHALMVEFFQGGSVGGCRMSWESDTIPKQIIPATALWHQPIIAPPPPEPGAGLIADFFDMGVPLWDVGDFQVYQKPTVSRMDPIISYSSEENFALKDLHAHFYARWTGKVNIPKSGLYTFTLSSDDGSYLSIDRKIVIDHNGRHKMVEKTGKVELSAGPHDIKVDYYQNEGFAGCVLLWEGPGIEKQIIPSTAFSH